MNVTGFGGKCRRWLLAASFCVAPAFFLSIKLINPLVTVSF